MPGADLVSRVHVCGCCCEGCLGFAYRDFLCYYYYDGHFGIVECERVSLFQVCRAATSVVCGAKRLRRRVLAIFTKTTLQVLFREQLQ